MLVNILTNAIDALEDRANKSVDQQRPDPDCITIATSRLGSDWVQIAISDNGSGMSETTRQRIFNPFFTTKPINKGTGMGMSISHQIITETHGGKLKCCSTVGKGTEFLIQIPIRNSFPSETHR